jgi:hypothetical protein
VALRLCFTGVKLRFIDGGNVTKLLNKHLFL